MSLLISLLRDVLHRRPGLRQKCEPLDVVLRRAPHPLVQRQPPLHGNPDAGMIERNISDETIRQAGATAEIVEDYPNDKYSPSCLLLGVTPDGRPLHLQVSRAYHPTVKIITVYVPSLDEWEPGFTKRRRHS